MDSLTLIFSLLLSFHLLSQSSSSAVDLCADAPRSSAGPNDLSIFHVGSKCVPFSPATPSPSEFDSVLAAAQKDPARLAYLSSLAVRSSTKVPLASGLQFSQTNNYVVRVKLGTPGQLMFPAFDIGSDVTWVPCAGCSGCPSAKASFAPAKSSTYKPVGCYSAKCPQFKGQACAAAVGPASCGFNMSYGGDSSLTATLSQDSLRLALDVVPSYAYGCVNSVTGGKSLPKEGLLGLGRGPTGLLAQAGSLYQGVFSYCLPRFKSYYFSGSLRLGPYGQPLKFLHSTPLLSNPHRPSLYYVGLNGVSVGRVNVAVPAGSFDFDPQTGAGTIIDSGTVITRFVAPAYAAIRDEFRRQVNASSYSSLGAFDTCYATNGDQPEAPIVTLHLMGLDLMLPMENTLIHSSATPLACLAMAAAPDNVNSVVNIIANYQQQNHRVLIDVANSRFGFLRELCS